MAKLSLGKLKNHLDRLTQSLIQGETKKIILSDNKIIFRKQDEMELGQRPDGSDIGTYAWPEYALFKQQLNPLAGGKVDIKLTGATHAKIRVISLGNGRFKLESTNEKWPGLVLKYGKVLEAINKTAFNELQRIEYAPKLNKKLKAIAKL